MLRKALEMSKIEAEESSMIKKLEEKAAQKEAVQSPPPVATHNDPKPGSYEPINLEKEAKIPEVSAPSAPGDIAMPVPRRNRRNVQPMEPLPPVKGAHKKHE
jgi:hypothetical protein